MRECHAVPDAAAVQRERTGRPLPGNGPLDVDKACDCAEHAEERTQRITGMIANANIIRA